MSNFDTIEDWIKIHTDGTCDEASDCLITLAQAIQKELAQPHNKEKGGE